MTPAGAAELTVLVRYSADVLAELNAEHAHWARRVERLRALEAAGRSDDAVDYADGVRYGLDLALALLSPARRSRLTGLAS